MLDIQDVHVLAQGRAFERRVHLLRHSFASALVRCNVPSLTIGRLVRDRDRQIAARYAKDSREHMAECVATLSFPVPAMGTITDISAARQGKRLDTPKDGGVIESALLSEITGEEPVVAGLRHPETVGRQTSGFPLVGHWSDACCNRRP